MVLGPHLVHQFLIAVRQPLHTALAQIHKLILLLGE